MTTEETEKFYEGDKKSYIVEKNGDFLTWYRMQLKLGYEPLLDLDEMQDLITKIKSWYELKYTSKSFEPNDNYQEQLSINKISESFTMAKFKETLTEKEKIVLETPYRQGTTIITNKEYSKDVIRTNGIDNSLKEKLLKMSALALFYSQDTTPEHAIERVKLMIRDCNKEYKLNMSSSMYELKIAKAKSDAGTSSPIKRVNTPTIYKPNKEVLTKRKKKRK